MKNLFALTILFSALSANAGVISRSDLISRSSPSFKEEPKACIQICPYDKKECPGTRNAQGQCAIKVGCCVKKDSAD